MMEQYHDHHKEEESTNNSMEGMFVSSMPKPSQPKSTNYTALLENDEDNFFEGILSADQNTTSHHDDHNSHHFISSSSKSDVVIPVNSKRQLPSPFWNEAAASMGTHSSSSKRFHTDLNSGGAPGGVDESNTSFVSMLNQLPQNAAFHPNSLLGSLGDGVLRPQFQLPTMNWNS